MAVIVKIQDWHDAVHIINCLKSVAETRGPNGRLLAKRLNRIADDLADALDAGNVGGPTPVLPDILPTIQYTALAEQLEAAGYHIVDDRDLDKVQLS